MKLQRLLTFILIVTVGLLFTAQNGFSAVISSTELIAGGQAYLIDQQAANGSWNDSRNSGQYVASTAIALAALMETGVSKDHAAVKNGVNYLLSQFNGTYFPGNFTYANGAAIMALSMYAPDNAITRTMVLSATQNLLSNQYDNPSSTAHGSWWYSNAQSSNGDLSNTQFAAMGLYYAEQYLGALQEPGATSWKDALYTYLQNCLHQSSGASYYEPGYSYAPFIPSMTGASLWCTSLIGRETDPIAVGSTITGSVTPGNVGYFESNYVWKNPPSAPQFYYLYAWAKGLTAAVGVDKQVGGNNWVNDMLVALSDLATPGVRKNGVQQYSWTGTHGLDGGNVIGTSWAMMSMAFADINVESPEKRVADVPDEGTIDYPIRGLLTLKTEGGVTITGAKRRLADLFRWRGRQRLKLPVGAVEFKLNHVPVGGTAKLTIKLPRDAVRNDVADSFVDDQGNPKPYLNWFKIKDGEWKGTVPITIDTVAETITVVLTDGGPEDADGVANGEIVDPGAPGITDEALDEPAAAAEDDQVTYSVESSSNSPCFIGAIVK